MRSLRPAVVLKPVLLLLAFALSVQPVVAQRRPAPKKPAAEPPPQQQTVSFETLLAADTYKVYGEVRGVGQLIRSDGVKDLVDPVLKLSAPPREFKALVKWLNLRADALLTSRLLFAAWPSKPGLPQALVAVEFPSAEEAQKFEPQLREFLPKLLPAASPEPSPARKGATPDASAEKQQGKPAGPTYILKQVGQLVFITDTPFKLKDLVPKGSKLLAEDPTFRIAHERFMSDSVFLYMDFAGIQREEEKERKQRAEEEQKRIEAAEAAVAANAQKETKAEGEPETTPEEGPPEPPPAGTPDPSNTAVTTDLAEIQDKPRAPEPMEAALSLLAGSFFGGEGKWPDGIGASLLFDGDSYVARVLLVNPPTEKASAIPFFPRFITGPLLVPEAPSVLPSDTELFISASVDLPQIHDGMAKSTKAQFEQMRNAKLVNTDEEPQPVSPFDLIEKKLGIKIKDEVLPLLGNEIAVTIPMSVINGDPPEPEPKEPKDEQKEPGQITGNPKTDQATKAQEGPSPVIAISIKDREGVRALLPKLVDSLGFKGASMMAQTEKREDTELVSYADAFAYALIGNFLIVSSDAKAIRHVVDSYVKHETLAANTNFRNYTRWQPRQVLGQVYLSPALMESYNSFARDAQISDQFRDFLMMVSPVAQPVTYALANEGQGPLHELHIPKNLLMMVVAGMSADSNQPPAARNEAITRSKLRMIASAEATYRATAGNGRYGTLGELVEASLIAKESTETEGYKIEVTLNANGFEVTAVPLEYGKSGKLSFFLDETGVLRQADRAGGPANVADKPQP
jgi:hypothetical protein